jgi:hypothetical protein
LAWVGKHLNDLATAILGLGALTACFLQSSHAMSDSPVSLQAVAKDLVRVGISSLGRVLIGGVIQAGECMGENW